MPCRARLFSSRLGRSGGGKVAKKKETKLGLRAKKNAAEFGEWYTQAITQAELIDYYDISGCFILRPDSYSIWERIQGFFDKEIKALGVKNAYFPMFVSEAALCKEEDHVEGFAPEVAWVTQSGDTPLKERIAVRPTSETIMYPAYSKWIRSHRDLPLRLNQWTNVVRWEFKHATPFIRTREFLWQEGHSAFATRDEADIEVLDILDRYARVYEELLAVPVIKGRKSEKEKFAGGLYTTTVEAFIPTNGRAIQGATSHCLGQNFSKMFDITFATHEAAASASASSEDGPGVGREYVWQNSWGLTTRTIGVMIMVHGDDKGLVMPPRVAPVQVVVVPIVKTKDAVGRDETIAHCKLARDCLAAKGIRVELDDRDNYTPGWKYAHWEQKGVPVRLEIGPRDIETNSCVLVSRIGGDKVSASVDEHLGAVMDRMLEGIQATLLDRARKERDERISIVTDWKDFMPALDKGNMVLAPWCDTVESEEWVKTETKAISEAAEASRGQVADARAALSGAAKTLCIPLAQPPMPEGQLCFTGNGLPAKVWALWGRSY
jgi:prolyl-tRNA synthetase